MTYEDWDVKGRLVACQVRSKLPFTQPDWTVCRILAWVTFTLHYLVARQDRIEFLNRLGIEDPFYVGASEDVVDAFEWVLRLNEDEAQKAQIPQMLDWVLAASLERRAICRMFLILEAFRQNPYHHSEIIRQIVERTITEQIPNRQSN